MSKLNKDYAKRKLELLLRDLSNYNTGEFWREMSRIASGATGKPHAEELQQRITELEQREVELAAHVERLYNKLEQLLHHPENGQTRHEGYAILSSTPTTSLNAVLREAFIEGFVDNYKTAYRDKDIAKREANINAKQRYPDKEDDK